MLAIRIFVAVATEEPLWNWYYVINESEVLIMVTITSDITLHQLVTEHNGVKTFLEANDFDVSDGLLNGVGKTVTLKMALDARNINEKIFMEQLHTAVNDDILGADTTLNQKGAQVDKAIDIKGVLPCPVRIPLLESFEGWLAEDAGVDPDTVSYELQAASMGVDWLKDELIRSEDENTLSDIFLSAGFDIFFDHNLLEKFKEQHVFADYSGLDNYNSDFNNDRIRLQDPKREYAMIGVVPAVFLVNNDMLQDREMPRTWADLLKPEFENSVSLPVGDFDLFNAILLNIYKNYGKEGVMNLKRCFWSSLHPAEMVKSHTKVNKPTVTIMPYFFTKMAKPGGPMTAVWPEDGAIISPIFMLAKKSKEDQLKPFVEFFGSKAVGEILSHNGRFPSVHPEVDNQDAKGNDYMWIGWDFIENNDIGKLIADTTAIFEGGAK